MNPMGPLDQMNQKVTKPKSVWTPSVTMFGITTFVVWALIFYTFIILSSEENLDELDHRKIRRNRNSIDWGEILNITICEIFSLECFYDSFNDEKSFSNKKFTNSKFWKEIPKTSQKQVVHY